MKTINEQEVKDLMKKYVKPSDTQEELFKRLIKLEEERHNSKIGDWWNSIVQGIMDFVEVAKPVVTPIIGNAIIPALLWILWEVIKSQHGNELKNLLSRPDIDLSIFIQSNLISTVSLVLFLISTLILAMCYLERFLRRIYGKPIFAIDGIAKLEISLKIVFVSSFVMICTITYSASLAEGPDKRLSMDEIQEKASVHIENEELPAHESPDMIGIDPKSNVEQILDTSQGPIKETFTWVQQEGSFKYTIQIASGLNDYNNALLHGLEIKDKFQNWNMVVHLYIDEGQNTYNLFLGEFYHKSVAQEFLQDLESKTQEKFLVKNLDQTILKQLYSLYQRK